MPRPQKCRRICQMPAISSFGPAGDEAQQTAVVEMSVDEYETIRLMDLIGYSQEDCARQMGVARTTVQAVYNEARRKLAEVLVYGKQLQIRGGAYEICAHAEQCCGKTCGRSDCRKKRCESGGAEGGCHHGACRRQEEYCEK